MKLLGPKLDGLLLPLVLSFAERLFKEKLLEKVEMVEVPWVSFQKCEGRQRRLLRVEFLGLLKLKQRR